MRLILLSSLDALARQAAAEHLHARRPGALFVRWDTGADGALVRRHFRHGEPGVLHHAVADAGRPGRRSAALHDLGHHVVEQLTDADGPEAGADRTAVLLLPMGLSANDALRALGHSAPVLAPTPTGLSVEAVVLACDPETAEDALWDLSPALEGERPTLLEGRGDPDAPGFAVEGDHRPTAGEFLAGELAFCSTVLAVHAVHPVVAPHDPEAYRRGVELVRDLGPHLTVVDAGAVQRTSLPPGSSSATENHSTDAGRLGAFDLPAALLRCRPGTIPSPRDAGADPATVVLRTDRPLDPALFHGVLGELVRGACRVRGTLHFRDDPHRLVAIEGVGPYVWLEPADPDPGAPGYIAGLLDRPVSSGAATRPAPDGDSSCGCTIALTSPLQGLQRLQSLLQQATGTAVPDPPGAREDAP